MPPSTYTPDKIWYLVEDDTPVIATAIHDGHAVRKELERLYALPDLDRLREEDPFTGNWAKVAGTHVVGLRSRFEVDLNRPREKAVYQSPEDAWGLTVYSEPLPPDVLERSLAEYDAFYAAMHELFSHVAQKHPRFVVLDLHTYNHRRAGACAPAAETKGNPEVNIGTGTMSDRQPWAAMIDRLIRDLHDFDYDGGHLDVRENVKFFGGNFARWAHEKFPGNACVLSVEFKKFFMDEWSGKPDEDQLGLIHRALESTIPGIMEELGKLTAPAYA